jgi:hypothetical protein
MMRLTLRSMFVLVVAVCALGGAAASASASSYEYIAAGKAVSTSAGVTGTRGASTLTWTHILGGGPTFIAKCTGGSSSGTLEKEGKSSYAMTITGCGHLKIRESGKEEEIKACTFGNVTLSGYGTLSKGGSSEIENDLTEVRGNFAIEGKECVFRTRETLAGSMKCVVVAPEAERVEHEGRCEPSEGSLVVGDEAATLETVEAVKLSGTLAGRKWSARNAGYIPREHGFRVEGKELTASVGFAGTRGATTITGTLFEESIVIHCTGGASTGTFEAKGLISAGEGTITGCSLWVIKEGKEVELPLCKVATFKFSDKGTLVQQGYGLGSEFVQTSEESPFAKVSVTGSECALKKSSSSLEGRNLSCLLSENEIEKVEHKLSCSPKEEAQPQITFSGSPATIETTEALKLTGTSEGKDWSAR